MANATKTIGAGMKVLGGGNVPSFTLEYLNDTTYKKSGSTETIVVPFIELGRDSRCAIRFGNIEPTVSRKHAAIKQGNGNTIITSLSETNPTLVNGRPINGDTILNNGDEIQLSAQGPRIRFLASQAKTSSIRLTARMNLFAQQSLRPYKRAVTLLAIILILALGGLGYLNFMTQQQLQLSQEEFDKLIVDRKNDKDLQAEREKEFNTINDKLAFSINKLKKDNKALANKTLKPESEVIQEKLDKVKEDVFMIYMRKLSWKSPDGSFKHKENVGSGTGFLTKDGRFITAHHCTEPWLYPTTDAQWLLNSLATEEGYVEMELFCVSPAGRTMTFKSTEFRSDPTDFNKINSDNKLYTVTKNWSGDWAYVQTNKKGNIELDTDLSANLSQGKSLHTLGYTFGSKYQEDSKLFPLYGKETVMRQGLHNNLIHVQGVNYNSGNSGGPVFTLDTKGNLKAVGIVSHSYKESIGGIVPVYNLR